MEEVCAGPYNKDTTVYSFLDIAGPGRKISGQYHFEVVGNELSNRIAEAKIENGQIKTTRGCPQGGILPPHYGA